jgi:hypothetical protein
MDPHGSGHHGRLTPHRVSPIVPDAVSSADIVEVQTRATVYM